MPVLKKSPKKESSRQQIRLNGVQEGILELPNSEYRLILQISSINFELMSEVEQDAIIETYQTFLNSLSTPSQILVRVRELDIDKYLEDFEKKTATESSDVYRSQAQNYITFVKSLITTNKILSRNFYIVLPYTAAKDTDFTVVQEQLKTTAGIVAKGLGKLGMQTTRLSSLDALDLFYSFYSPVQCKRQPLKQQTIEMLARSYV